MDHTQSMTKLKALAAAELTSSRAKQQEETETARLGYRVAVGDAAAWTAEVTFGHKAAELLDWLITDPENSPEGTAEAAVVVPTEPYSVLLCFRAPKGTAEEMHNAGRFYMVRECSKGGCEEEHAHPVDSLADLGELLHMHSVGEIRDPHAAPAAA